MIAPAPSDLQIAWREPLVLKPEPGLQKLTETRDEETTQSRKYIPRGTLSCHEAFFHHFMLCNLTPKLTENPPDRVLADSAEPQLGGDAVQRSGWAATIQDTSPLGALEDMPLAVVPARAG